MGKIVSIGKSRKWSGEIQKHFHKSESEAMLKREFTSISGVFLVSQYVERKAILELS